MCMTLIKPQNVNPIYRLPTSIRSDSDVQLLRYILQWGDLGLLVEVLGPVADGPGRLQLALGLREFGGRHHLHGLGDLLDVLHRFQADRDRLQSGHASLLLLQRGVLDHQRGQASKATQHFGELQRVLCDMVRWDVRIM